MKKYLIVSFLGVLGMSTSLFAQEPIKLSGSAISDAGATGYAQLAFDGDEATLFHSHNASHAWVGLEFSAPQIITKVRWHSCPGTYTMTFVGEEEHEPQNEQMPYSHLAIFEGANHADFTDAIPLYLVASKSTDGGWNEAEVNVDRGFRFVRYVGPNSSYGNVNELEFFGYEGEGNGTQYYQATNLPTLVVHTQSGEDMVDKVTNLDAEAYLIYTSKNGNSKIIGDTCTIRGRSNDSWRYAKKPFRINFSHKVDMPNGGAKAKKWVLVNGFGDKSLMRNAIAFDMSRRLEMPYTSYCQPVDVILNGEYQGTYQLCDQIEVGKRRVNIEKMDETCISGDELTGGYLYEYDGNYNIKSLSEWQQLSDADKAGCDVGFFTAMGNPITIKSPSESKMQQAQLDYLKDYLDMVEAQVYSGSSNLSDYLDLESFARFFILGEYTGNPDTFFEMYQYKQRGDDHLYFGPCWDFDLAYDNDARAHDYLTDKNATGWLFQTRNGHRNGGSCIEDYNTTGRMRDYVNRILSNSTTQQLLRENWAYVRATDLVSVGSMVGQVAIMMDSLRQSQELNFNRWPILSTKYHQNYQALGSWDDEVMLLGYYMMSRLPWFDKALSLSAANYQLTIPEGRWTSIYLPYAVMMPAGLKAYAVSGIREDGTLALDSVFTTRPNRPYLVRGSAGQYTLPCYSVSGIESQSLGLLTGTMSGTEAPVGSYVMQDNAGRLAFCRVEEGQTVNVAAQKAYLTLPADLLQEVGPAFYFDEQPEGISELHMAQSGTLRVYSLAGKLLREYAGEWSEEQIAHDLGRGSYVLTDGQKSWKRFAE